MWTPRRVAPVFAPRLIVWEAGTGRRGRGRGAVACRNVHPNTERVESALTAGGSSSRIVELTESARTAADAAAALGCPVAAIVKSLVFTADGHPILVLASGAHRVDTGRIAALLQVGRVVRADPDLVRTATGFPIGGVTPIGHPRPLPTVVDTALAEQNLLWAAAGTPHAVFPTTYAELLRLTAGQPGAVAETGTDTETGTG